MKISCCFDMNKPLGLRMANGASGMRIESIISGGQVDQRNMGISQYSKGEDIYSQKKEFK